MSEYTCFKCQKTFPKTNNEEWNDFKAAEEFLILHPECKNDTTDILCDDCNELFKQWFSNLLEEQKKEMRIKNE